MLLSIPETDLRVLSSLLECVGLSELAYSHAANASMKLLKVAPPHQHLFITELSNAPERLSKVAAGVTLYGDLKAADILKLPKASSFHHEYSSMACTVEIIQDVYGAIDHIHRHGSAHTDCIITEDRDVAEAFLSQVDSAAVFLWAKLTSRPKDKNAFAAT